MFLFYKVINILKFDYIRQKKSGKQLHMPRIQTQNVWLRYKGNQLPYSVSDPPHGWLRSEVQQSTETNANMTAKASNIQNGHCR